MAGIKHYVEGFLKEVKSMNRKPLKLSDMLSDNKHAMTYFARAVHCGLSSEMYDQEFFTSPNFRKNLVYLFIEAINNYDDGKSLFTYTGKERDKINEAYHNPTTYEKFQKELGDVLASQPTYNSPFCVKSNMFQYVFMIDPLFKKYYPDVTGSDYDVLYDTDADPISCALMTLGILTYVDKNKGTYMKKEHLERALTDAALDLVHKWNPEIDGETAYGYVQRTVTKLNTPFSGIYGKYFSLEATQAKDKPSVTKELEYVLSII